MILLRLLRVRLAAEGHRKLFLTGGERLRVGRRPRKKYAGDFVLEQWLQRGRERTPGLEGAVVGGREHTLDPSEDIAGTRTDKGSRRRVGGALVELAVEPEVGERRPIAEQV